jgi:hypothetical protein
MRANDFYESAADDLKKKLPSLKKTDYDTIDKLMRRISRRYKITGKKLHDLFVSKYGETPDHWIKKYKEKIGEGDVVKFPVRKSLNRKRQTKVVNLPPKNQRTVTEPTGNITPLRLSFNNLPLDIQEAIYELYVQDEEGQNDILWELHKKGYNIEWEVPSPYDLIVIHEKTGKKYYIKQNEINSLYENVNEGVESDEDMQKIRDFIDWSIKIVNLEKPYPKIEISTDTDKAQKGHHTGVHTHDGKEEKIWIYVGNRNLIDIFRTIFHELVHSKQQQLNMIKHGDSYPGSPIEAMADMLAGKYIKIYGKKHPEIFQ